MRESESDQVEQTFVNTDEGKAKHEYSGLFTSCKSGQIILMKKYLENPEAAKPNT